jgi:hypothetical protein
MEVQTAHFTTINSRVCPQASHNVPWLPRCNCQIAPWTLMPLVHSGCARHLLPNVHPFEVPLLTLPLVQLFHCLYLTGGPLRPCPLCHATPAWWVIPLWAVANFFWDPPFPWVRFFGWPWCLVLISARRCAIVSTISMVWQYNDEDSMQFPIRPLLTPNCHVFRSV